jgi:hypothetical protein
MVQETMIINRLGINRETGARSYTPRGAAHLDHLWQWNVIHGRDYTAKLGIDLIGFREVQSP